MVRSMLDVLARKLFSALDTTIARGRSLSRASLGARGGSSRWVDFSSRLWASDLALSRQFLDNIQHAKWGRTKWGAN